MNETLLYYLIAANLAAFVVFGLDKLFAKLHTRRVPEKTLFLLAIIGGSVGAWLGMQIFRHKTLHKQFTIGIPLIFAVQLVLLTAGRFLLG